MPKKTDKRKDLVPEPKKDNALEAYFASRAKNKAAYKEGKMPSK